MSNEVKEKGTKSLIKKIFDILFYVVIGIIIVVALIYTVSAFSTKNGVTAIFGHTISSVQTGSMSGTFEKGDIIIGKQLDNEGIDKLEVDDIISFYFMEPQTQEVIIVTHRIIEIEPNGGKITTQGDVARANNSLDNVEVVSRGDVIAEYTGTKIPGLGKVADFVGTSTGFFCCVLIPVFLFLFWQIYVFAKTLSDAKKYGRQKQVNDEARALAEQMFKEMQANAQNDSSEENTDAQ